MGAAIRPARLGAAGSLLQQPGRASSTDRSGDDRRCLGPRRCDARPGRRQQLQADFWRGDTFDESLLALIRGLRTRYKTGVISNALPDARAMFSGRLNDDLFDVLVFSSEEGVKKPDPEIFLSALARLGVDAGESIFVDDVLENVEAARSLGLHSIHFRPDTDLERELARRGVRGIQKSE